METTETIVRASLVQLLGAGGFGMIIGWYVYMVNRYRKNDVELGDLVTIIGAIGGAAVLALFDAGSDLFGAYGIGLALGFFLYYIILVGLVARSSNFNGDWFLDGRRKAPVAPWGIPAGSRETMAAMNVNTPGQDDN
jgi:hypothetical protein